VKLEVVRYGIRITPENETDVAYIEEVLGLKKEGQSVRLFRRNAHKLSSIARLETEVDVASGEEPT
jgi:hypothetical protein